jgi:hypothetical protein
MGLLLKAAKRQPNVLERIHDLEQSGDLHDFSQVRWKTEELQFASLSNCEPSSNQTTYP